MAKRHIRREIDKWTYHFMCQVCGAIVSDTYMSATYYAYMTDHKVSYYDCERAQRKIAKIKMEKWMDP